MLWSRLMLKQSKIIMSKSILNAKRLIQFNPYRSFMTMNAHSFKLFSRSTAVANKNLNLVSPAQFFTNTMMIGKIQFIQCI